jgi:hypothetical protein
MSLAHAIPEALAGAASDFTLTTTQFGSHAHATAAS